MKTLGARCLKSASWAPFLAILLWTTSQAADAVYKPYALLDGHRWLMWHNGRRGGVEQIGLAIHEGNDLRF